MKALKIIFTSILLLMVSVFTFFTWNLITSVICNYQSPSKVLLSGIPMIMFLLVIIGTMFAVFNYVILGREDAFVARKYSIMIGSFSLVGIVFSILCGTYIYGSFFKDYIFIAYPFVMLLCHVVTFLTCVYLCFISIQHIVKNKPQKTWKNSKFHWFRELLLALMLIFALERFGGFIILPVIFSSYDSVYVIPVYLELLVPALLFVTFMLHEHFLHNRKITIILSSVALGFSVASLVYLLVIAKGTYPLVINPLSPVMQLERLVTMPIGTIVLYGFSILFSCAYLTKHIVATLKEKNKVNK